MLVQVYESAGHAGNRFAFLMELFDALHRRPQHLLEPGEPLGFPLLRNLEDPRLGGVEQLAGRLAGLVGLGNDLGPGLDQVPENGLLPNNRGVGFEVRRGRNRVYQLRDVQLATRGVNSPRRIRSSRSVTWSMTTRCSTRRRIARNNRRCASR